MNPVQLDGGIIFGGKATGRMVYGWDAPSEFTPEINQAYVFPSWSGDIAVWMRRQSEPLYVFGPTGCGKTSCVKQILARLNYPVYECTGHGRLEFAELVGHHTIQQGNMTYVYGPLSLAMKHGGAFLMNEVDIIPPDVAAGLNSVLDGGSLCVADNGGEIIKPHPWFRFVATANSNGGGDISGMYQGVLRQNLAFMDRFTLSEATYMPEELENNVLKAFVPELPDVIRDGMVKFATMVRKLFAGEEVDGINNAIEVTMSTRTIIRWAQLTIACERVRERNINVVGYALDRALAYRASPPTRVALHELRQRIFGE